MRGLGVIAGRQEKHRRNLAKLNINIIYRIKANAEHDSI